MWKKSTLLLCIMLSLLGCSTTRKNLPSSTAAITIMPSITSAIQISTTSTSTRIIPTLTPTLQPTLSATQTIAPTLSTEEALRRIKEFYKDNGVCNLPCWWGIVPGETMWEQAKQLLGPLGIMKNDYFEAFVPREMDPLKGPLPIDYVFGNVDARFYVDNNVVRVINVNSRWVNQSFDYSLSGILNVWGTPDEIWFTLYPESVTGTPHYDLYLLYSHKGMVMSRGFASVSGNLMTICPQKVLTYDGIPPWFMLWSSEEDVSFSDESEILTHFKTTFGEVFVQLENATDTSKDQFYEIYSKPNPSKCLDVPLPVDQQSIWQSN